MTLRSISRAILATAAAAAALTLAACADDAQRFDGPEIPTPAPIVQPEPVVEPEVDPQTSDPLAGDRAAEFGAAVCAALDSGVTPGWIADDLTAGGMAADLATASVAEATAIYCPEHAD